MKIFTGKVVSTKMQKTATVAVERIVEHPIYKKRFRRTRKYHIHDEADDAKVGQIVQFVASKPYSKLKRWRLINKDELKKIRASNKPKLKAAVVKKD